MIKNNIRTWKFSKVKANLTEFIIKAKQEPQVITKHGKPEILAMDV